MLLPAILLVSAVLSAAAPAAAQDAAAGQRVFNQCRACHTVEQGGRNGVGPNLHGMFGRPAAAVEGFRYSAAMRTKAEAGLVWTPETLAPYLRNPREAVPGGSMAFAGLRNEQQLADLIAYLLQATGAPR
jgi:cytochrome c